MRRSAIVTIIVVILVIAAVVYALSRRNANNGSNSTSQTQTSQPADNGSSGTSSNGTSGTTANNGQTGTAILTLNTATNPTLGSILVGPNGMTLYMYSKDTQNKSNCTGPCAVNWPPYTVTATSASNLAGALNVTGKIGTTTRADGTMQVTYNGQPLYYYIKDKNPGDVTGQNVGGVWFVVHP